MRRGDFERGVQDLEVYLLNAETNPFLAARACDKGFVSKNGGALIDGVCRVRRAAAGPMH